MFDVVDLLDPDEFFTRFLDGAGPGRHDRTPVGPVAQWRRWWRSNPVHDPLVAAAAARGFVLSTSQLVDLGVTRARCRWAIDRGSRTQVARGAVSPVDIRRDLPDQGGEPVLERRRHALAGAAAALRRPDDAVAGRSTAIMHGLPTVAVPSTPELNARGWVGLGRRPASHLFGGTLDARHDDVVRCRCRDRLADTGGSGTPRSA